MEDYYELLEISKNASKEVIEKAYKALIRKYHPDLADADKKLEYEEKMKKINLAYETIIDDDKRREYDMRLKEFENQNNNNNNFNQENVYQNVQPNENVNYQNNNNYMTNEEYQQEISNIKEAYNEAYNNAINEIAKDLYGEGNYYFVDNRPFKEKLKDFLKDFKHKLKVFLTFILVMSVVLIIVLLNEETRTSLIETFKPIVDFINRLITNLKNA